MLRIFARWSLALIVLFNLNRGAGAQEFVLITDPANPINNPPFSGGYVGAAWIDYDRDGDEDLFANRKLLFRNDGGSFTLADTSFIAGTTPGSGTTWADYDNDGDPDNFISGNPSVLYRNEGADSFAVVTAGDLGYDPQNPIRGWAAAWADYDNDGNVDLFITHPAGFVGAPRENYLFHNDGPPEYTFTQVLDLEPVEDRAPFTVATWSDFDLDGDPDLFIGSGPANANPAPDYLYRNLWTETGAATFERITGIPLADTERDGQVINWIDYDNDRDLDAYITNWGGAFGGMANELYRNDGGTFTRITEGAIVTDVQISLSSVWADFDNDGDLDCYVTNDNQIARYYVNNGDGTFASQTNAATINGPHRGAAAGDYDNDGDLDLFVNGVQNARKLFRNDLTNGNRYLKLHLEGTRSNRAAVGAKVWALATINGNPVWQLREVSAQNSFNSMNSLTVHFGLGDATQVDSLVIDWPAGSRQVFTTLAADQTYALAEGNPSDVPDGETLALPASPVLLQNYPNPFNASTTLRFALPRAERVHLSVLNLLGQQVAVLVNAPRGTGSHAVHWQADGLPTGIYLVRLEAGPVVEARRVLLLK